MVWARDDTIKHDPTAKVVIYGALVDQVESYDLLWTQVGTDIGAVACLFISGVGGHMKTMVVNHGLHGRW